MNTITLKIDRETMKAVTEAVKPLAKDNYVRFDFGTGVNQDKMITKVTVAAGAEQIETAVLIDIPKDGNVSEKDISVEKPLAVAVVKADDFLTVAESLLVYETDFTVTISDAEMLLAVANKANLPISLVDASLMKSIILHKDNSTKVEAFDPDVMYVRAVAKDILNALKRVSVLNPARLADNYALYMVNVKECTPVKEEREHNGQTRAVTVKNAELRFLSTNGCTFVGSTADVICKKVDTIKMYAPGEDGTVTEQAMPYAEYEKAYMEGKKITEMSGQYFFALPSNVVDVMTKLASSDGLVSIIIGVKFIRISINNVIYTAALHSEVRDVWFKMYEKLCQEYVERDSYITVDVSELAKALKVFSFYDKDVYAKALPLEMDIAKEITLKKENAECNVAAVEAHSDMELFTMGIHSANFAPIVATLPTGNTAIYYGLEKVPSCAICAGATIPTDGNCSITMGVDVEKAKLAVKAKKEKDQQTAEKKEK